MMFIVLLLVIGVLLASSVVGVAQAQEPPVVKVAFIADQGTKPSSRAVLELIRQEGVDMVIHSGDFGYSGGADAWEAQVNEVLGPSFPYFGSVGDEDLDEWEAYQRMLADRLARIPGAVCDGEYGVKAACTYKGIFFVLSGAGTLGSGHAEFIRERLEQSDSTWRICSWHKNQQAMQVGGKVNEVGWAPYEECRLGGAIIVTGHSHTYSRTKSLVDTRHQITAPVTLDSRWHNPQLLRVARGSTVVIVSGLGGQSVRNQELCLPASPPYGCNGEWARIYTSNQDATFGALFIEFGVDAEDHARGYFKNIDGDIIDYFTIVKDDGSPDSLASAGSAGGLANDTGAAPGISRTFREQIIDLFPTPLKPRYLAFAGAVGVFIGAVATASVIAFLSRTRRRFSST